MGTARKPDALENLIFRTSARKLVAENIGLSCQVNIWKAPSKNPNTSVWESNVALHSSVSNRQYRLVALAGWVGGYLSEGRTRPETIQSWVKDPSYLAAKLRKATKASGTSDLETGDLDGWTLAELRLVLWILSEGWQVLSDEARYRVISLMIGGKFESQVSEDPTDSMYCYPAAIHEEMKVL